MKMTNKIPFENLPELMQKLINEVSELKEVINNLFLEDRPLKYLSVSEAAEFLKISESTLYTKVSKNQIPFMKPDKILYFSQNDLEDYINKGKSKSFKHIKDDGSINLGSRY